MRKSNATQTKIREFVAIIDASREKSAKLTKRAATVKDDDEEFAAEILDAVKKYDADVQYLCAKIVRILTTDAAANMDAFKKFVDANIGLLPIK